MEDVLTSADITTQIAQVDRMLDRVEKVIGRERNAKPLRADTSYPRRAKPKPKPEAKIMPRLEQRPAVASGLLAGNEMRIGNGYSVRTWKSSDTCDPDGMWAAFETEFDEMVAGMR